MFERIIVTLDGSASAEAALPPARDLARRLGSSLVLLHVVEARPPKAVHGERHLASPAEAEAYLAPIARSLEAEGIGGGYHVHEGSEEASGSRGVAESVAEHGAELGTDLAVMAAHGRRGLAEALSGSLPLKVASSGGAAVLLVPRPQRGTDAPEALAPRRIVVPLDGRPEHEAALPAATALALAYGVGILLVAAVPSSAAQAGGPGAAFARLAPALSGASLEYAARGVADYLGEIAGRLAARGLEAERRVVRGRPDKAIVACCGAGDLLALSTHRKLGIDASLDGCVAFGAARRWRGAMLVVPVPRLPLSP